MSMDPLAPKVAERFYSALKRAFDTVKVRTASGVEHEHEVLKRYGHFVVHAMIGGRGYTVVHDTTGQEIKSKITSRKVADGVAKYLHTTGRELFQKAAKGDPEARDGLERVLQDFRPVPGPAKRASESSHQKGPSYPFEATADGNHIQRTFRSLDAALRAAIEFRRDHPGDSVADVVRVEQRTASKGPSEAVVVLRGTSSGWRILQSALSDAPDHLVDELLEHEDE
jgi:hypothetical protein